MSSKKAEAIMIYQDGIPEVYYLLPSGYKDKVICVFESAFEELDVELISKKKMEKMTNLKFKEKEE